MDCPRCGHNNTRLKGALVICLNHKCGQMFTFNQSGHKNPLWVAAGGKPVEK